MKPTHTTRDHDEWRTEIRRNNEIWSGEFRKNIAAGFKSGSAANMARDKVSEFRENHPFPWFLVGGLNEESTQDDKVSGLVLEGIPGKGTVSGEVHRKGLSDVALSEQLRDDEDEAGPGESPVRLGIDAIRRVIPAIT